VSVSSIGVGDLETTPAAARPRRLDVWGAVRRALPPVAIGVTGLVVWELLVRLNQIPYYILPGPLLVIGTLVRDWGTLYPSLLVTLAITGAALLVATVAGVLIAILFTQSRWVELSLFPYAVILQVTPVVAIAPLIIIWVKNIPLSEGRRFQFRAEFFNFFNHPNFGVPGITAGAGFGQIVNTLTEARIIQFALKYRF